MTRKNFILRLIAVALVLSAILPTAAASAPLVVNQGESDGELKTIYITWQYPIPPSEKGDKLNMSVGVLVNGKTYASHDVFNVLGIPKCPYCEGTVMTVDGETSVYYPLRESAEQFGYSVLWAPKSEQDGNVLEYWVYIAKKDVGTDWIQVMYNEVSEDNYKYYEYYYAYSDDSEYWKVVWGDETECIPKEKATVME